MGKLEKISKKNHEEKLEFPCYKNQRQTWNELVEKWQQFQPTSLRETCLYYLTNEQP